MANSGRGQGDGGFSDGVKVIGEIVSPARKPVSQAAAQAAVDPRVLDTLAEAISVSRDPKTFVVTVEVKSSDAAKSALIANRLVSTFLDEEQSAQSGFSSAPRRRWTTRLAELRRHRRGKRRRELQGRARYHPAPMAS